MEGRLAMLGFIAAVAGVQTLQSLPSVAGRCLLAGAMVAAALVRWRAGRLARAWHVAARSGVSAVASCACALSGGALYAIERAQFRLDDALPLEQENQVARVVLRVASLVEFAADAARFDAEILHAEPASVPRRLRVSWPVPVHGDSAALRVVMPGQQWRAALVLKRPHAPSNPHAADGEARLFQRNVRATATVRGKPQWVGDEGWRPGMAAVHRARHVLRERMQDVLAHSRYGAVIVALALGDQAGVGREDWQVFNATGITHLVSISGLHVTLVAGLAGAAVAWCWRRLRWRGLCLAEWMPAQLAGIAAALCVAWGYCLLAGWGIPARRTFFMLAVIACAALLRVPLSRGAMLSFAACVVVALDPWATVAAGFWLSFGAVAAVLAWGHATHAPVRAPAAGDDPDAGAGRLRRWLGGWCLAARLQCVVTLGLTPVLAFLTQQVALASPLANAVAIPAVSLVVTPLALLCAAFCALPGTHLPAQWSGQAAQWAFGATMWWIEWLAARQWAVRDVAAPPFPLLVLAIAGIAWALLPPGMASRRWAWLLIVPALCWRPSRPPEGEWRLTALDVGQGGAIVVETARRTLVFDAGPLHRNGTDGAQRAVWPYLRARGVKHIDTLVVSHGDQDHAGGLDSLLRAVPVDTAFASFDLPARLRRDARVRGLASVAPRPALTRHCAAGLAWEADGVRFAFVHPVPSASPLPDSLPSASRLRRDSIAPQGKRGTARQRSRGDSNAGGCVLLVQGRHHTALLPGDVATRQEREFADVLPRIDVLIAPHHGSATSSGPALVEAARPDHVIAQVGYLNRFRHPAPVVQRRWRRAGATFWRTDRDGAVIALSAADGLTVYGQRRHARRYWHAVEGQ
ncbi:DNA internalization-related competence protein ComEC/Rec2 [Bordetella bronchialis]|uniref:DNA internalization-related competence protein ComEC/Rec2 n=1 Tax=Bordetella bronchialis TaxID=463025 RepID=A0A193FZ85_9BORD|nr:DNA internalization-related competence protein ComEC/Rec2 [Bordetella bronchialis]ANN72698.1 DNA internalization-related competence protein ComEC/Rec2 [Bordetella bronchialis]